MRELPCADRRRNANGAAAADLKVERPTWKCPCIWYSNSCSRRHLGLFLTLLLQLLSYTLLFLAVQNFPCTNGQNTAEMLPIPFPFPAPAQLPRSQVELLSSNGTVLSSHVNETELFVSHYADHRLVHNIVVRGLTPGEHYWFTVRTEG